MSAAGYNRWTRIIAANADLAMPSTQLRADIQAHKDEAARLREQVARLERELARARRCIAAERYAREKRASELKADVRARDFGISTLCRIAFPGDS